MSRLITLVVIIILFTTFAWMNADQILALHYFKWSTPPLPAYQVVMGAFVLGGLFVVVLLFPEWVRLRLELRRYRKAMKKADTAMSKVRPAEPAPPEYDGDTE
jgi:uncharacterized integral membrane protein